MAAVPALSAASQWAAGADAGTDAKADAGPLASSAGLGPAKILHLPGKAFVEYQLFAQSVRPDDFVAVAAYGELGPGYICTDNAFVEGGYEPTQSFVGPPSETLLKASIHEVLKDSG